MIYTKEEFKRLWESGDDGGGITNDDVADCAKEWGLFPNPRICNMHTVTNAVLKAAGIEDIIEVSEKETQVSYSINEDMAWKIYGFVSMYKGGHFGLVSLQEALDKHFEKWMKK